MAEAGRAALAAFDVELRRSTRMRWPAGGSYGPDERVAFEPGLGDLLELRHAPSRRFLGREPVHENLLIELAHPLTDAPPQALRAARVLYRAGSDRITYQATRSVGTFTLVEVTPARYVIDAALTLLTPEIDSEHRGSHQLAGQIIVPR